MADLITLEGTAQEKGKKVVGYKFPNNLDELKFPFKVLFQPNYAVGLKEKTTTDKGITYKNIDVPSREVIIVKRDGKNLLTKEGYVLSSYDTNKIVISPEKINLDSIPSVPVTPSKITTSSSNSTIQNDLNNSDLGKTARKIQIGFSVVGWGVFGILAYKFWNKSTAWKVAISVFGAYNLYNTYKTFSKPALKLEGGSNSNTNTGKTTTGTTTGTSNNLTKSQKIDLIIKNMNSRQGAESSFEDEQNTRAFLMSQQPVALDRWVLISKALNDSEINNAMETNQQQGFALLKSKYGLAQQDIEQDMQKLMDFLMGSVESAISSQGNNSAFSNFESSLNLDL